MNPLFILLLIILVILLACLIGLYSSPLLINCNKFGGTIPNPDKSEFLRIYEETSLKGVDIAAKYDYESFEEVIRYGLVVFYPTSHFNKDHTYLQVLEFSIENKTINSNANFNLTYFKTQVNNKLSTDFQRSWLNILITKLSNIDMQSIDDNTFIFMCLIIYDLIMLFNKLSLDPNPYYLFMLIKQVTNCNYKNLSILLHYIYNNDLLPAEIKELITLDGINKEFDDILYKQFIAKIQPSIDVDNAIAQIPEYKKQLVEEQITQERELRVVLLEPLTQESLIPYINIVKDCNSDAISYIKSLNINQIALLILFIYERSKIISNITDNLSIMSASKNDFMDIIIYVIYTFIQQNNLEKNVIFDAKINISIIYLFLIFYNISNTKKDIIQFKNMELIKFGLFIKCIDKSDFLEYLLFIFSINDGSELISNFNSIFRDIIMNKLYEINNQYLYGSPNTVSLYIDIMLLYSPRIYSEADPVFAKYSVIELDSEADSSYLSNIIKHIGEILSWSRKSTKDNIVDVIFDSENDNNRDKFLNNLGLLVVGYDNINREYICILLYPFLFKAYKAYQMTIDSQSGEENIFTEGDPNYTKKGGGENCILCTCAEFIPKEDDAEICTCGHTILQHNKTERLKSNFKKMASNIISQKNIKEKIRQKNKLEFLLQLYKNKFKKFGNLSAFKFFKIPFNIAKKWKPMLIKSFSQYKEYYNTINPANNMNYKNMKKFIISAHGGTATNHSNIKLLPNEIVIMSCNILETVNSYRIKSLIRAFISPLNSDLIHIDNIEYLISIKEPIHRQDATLNHDGREYGYRNSYCIYTNKCPELILSFYDYDSKFRENLPFFIYETPMRYSSATIRAFLESLGLHDRISSVSTDILDLPLNVDTDLMSPNMLKYLFNDINYLASTNWLHHEPTEAQLNEYIPRIIELVDKLNSQNNSSSNMSTREVNTYFDHIDFRLKERALLSSEINNMRRYWQSLSEDKWENNPNKYVIYFVEACRS